VLTLHELRAVGTATADVPRALRLPGCQSIWGGCPARPESGPPGPARPQLDAPAPARWLAYYADRDRVVPAASARLDDPRYAAVNLPIPGCDHESGWPGSAVAA
jgi:hypothetical protein